MSSVALGTAVGSRVVYVLASSAEIAGCGVARHALCARATRGVTLCGLAEPAGGWQLHGFTGSDPSRLQCERCRAALPPAPEPGPR